MKSLKYFSLMAALRRGTRALGQADLVLSPLSEISRRTAPELMAGTRNNRENNFFRLTHLSCCESWIQHHGHSRISMAPGEYVFNLPSGPVRSNRLLLRGCASMASVTAAYTVPAEESLFSRSRIIQTLSRRTAVDRMDLAAISPLICSSALPAGVPDSGTTAMLLGGALAGLGPW